MQAGGPDCLGEFSCGIAMRADFGYGPITDAAVVHRKAVVMLGHWHNIFRSGFLE